jgi:phosphate transport system substrate-binding protein
MRRNAGVFLLVLGFILMVSLPAMAGTLKVAGSGGMISLVTELADAYMKKHPETRIEVKQKSIEAKGGILGAASGRLDIGMAARNLKKSEKDLGLEVHEIARVALVIGVNAETVKAPAGITSRQLCDIYEGKITNWKEIGGADVPIKPLTRPDADSTKVTVRKSIPCFSELKEVSTVVVMPKSKDMFRALSRTPNAIGLTDLVAVFRSRGKIRPLQLDGISPSADAVAKGKWPVVKHMNLILGKKRSREAYDFIRFIRSPEGRKIIEKNQAVPVGED